MAAGPAVLSAGLLSASRGAASATPPQSLPPLPDNALITLGVEAGPPPVPNRFGISSALKIGSDVYVIDCGLGSLNAFTNAGLQFADLRSMFITHLHTDHIVDYFSFFLPAAPMLRWGGSRYGFTVPVQPEGSRRAKWATRIHHGELADPTPGLAATTKALTQAFAYTSNIFIRGSAATTSRNW